MKIIKRIRIVLIGFIALFHLQAFAQAYPNKPITVIVPFSAGSASDVVTRVLLDKVSNVTGTRFVFDNRPAAGGNVGTAALVRAEPDGYTIGISTSGPLAIMTLKKIFKGSLYLQFCRM